MGEFTNTRKHKHTRSVSRDIQLQNNKNQNFIVLKQNVQGIDVVECINKTNEQIQHHHLIVQDLNYQNHNIDNALYQKNAKIDELYVKNVQLLDLVQSKIRSIYQCNGLALSEVAIQTKKQCYLKQRRLKYYRNRCFKSFQFLVNPKNQFQQFSVQSEVVNFRNAKQQIYLNRILFNYQKNKIQL